MPLVGDPTTMFSRTERSLSSRVIWNVRLIPSRVTLCGIHPVISVSPNVTVPPSGGTMPLITSNAVVLPAPLGPMRPVIDPSTTSKEQARTASTPPYALLIAFTSRSPLMRALRSEMVAGASRLPPVWIAGAAWRCLHDEGADDEPAPSYRSYHSALGYTRSVVPGNSPIGKTKLSVPSCHWVRL